ncbi:anthranilate/para-aminobenzoate synthase component I [Thiovulum sp. ES]|nr:anthranilate/para-aminobenzoate synthase component I [Thiovulum sp. ES]
MIHSKKIFLDQITPVEIFAKLENFFPNDPALLFESAENGEFSFVILGAKERIQYRTGNSENPFENLQKRYKELDSDFYKSESERLSVPFVDGFIGYIGYDAIELFEPKLKERIENLENEIDIPDIDLIRPKIIIAYSHKKNIVTILSSESEEHFGEIEKELKSQTEFRELKKAKFKGEGSFQHDKETFHKMIQESKKMIRSGDVFQILISNRYKREFDEVDPFSFYRVLRSKNPSPYMFYMNYRDFHIVGSSPEVMVTLRDEQILLRPIAGTRKRGKNITRDRELEIEMINDPKEISEHLMLIDLGRNDIGRVAKSGSVKVPNMFRVERYSHVMHMVSDIEAEIDPKFDMFDLLKATFTAGTMTGAPKIRAMELIADYEKLKRNFYSGVVGYFGFDGNMDTAITIRTTLIKDNILYLHAGAGIVADSVEELESLEVRNKMNALLSTIEDLQN